MLIPMIAMDSNGSSVLFYMDPGKLTAQGVVDVLSALNRVHQASGGDGLMFRLVEYPDPEIGWQEGAPPAPSEGEEEYWIVKRQGETMPEEVVFSRFGQFHVFNPRHLIGASTAVTSRSITHHRPLSSSEMDFLNME